MKTFLYMTAMTSCILLSGVANADYIVDDFTEGSISSPNGAPPPTDIPKTYFGNVPTILQGDYSSIIGGYRSISSTTSSGGFVFISENLAGFSPTPSFTFSPAGGSNYTTTFVYDANGAGLGGVDLTQGGVNNALVLRALKADKGVRFTFTVYDSNGNGSEKYLVPDGVASAMNLYFSFNSFNPIVDFTDVAKIVLTVDAIPNLQNTSDLDWSISNISATVVPEPTSLALAGFAGIGMAVGAIRRRRQAKQAV